MIALQRLCESIETTGISCELDADLELAVENNAIATHVYRIAQESLTNAMRHACANQLRVRLDRTHDELRLIVSDDGTGFDAAETHSGMGLRILRHRSELIGGSLVIDSKSNGTTVTCVVQLHGA